MATRKRSATLGTIKYVDKVGVELEGAWERYDSEGKVIRSQAPRNLKGDCSVTCYAQNGANGQPSRHAGWSGEIASHPILPDAHVLGQWIKRNYPDRVDSSCGLHVHLSLRNDNDYAKLVTAKFGEHVNRELTKFGNHYSLPARHEFWSRLKGDQSYCTRQFKGEDQLNRNTSDRYTQINFCALRRHGTVEIRTLPGFRDCYVAIGAIYTLIRAVESFLARFDQEIADGCSQFKMISEFEVEMPDAPENISFEEIDLGTRGDGDITVEIQDVEDIDWNYTSIVMQD